MFESLTRRRFVSTVSTGAALFPLGLTGPSHARQTEQKPGAADPADGTPSLPSAFPSHEPSLARDVVGKSHSDYDTVKRLVEQRPALAKAAWDWGFGDWETALGAASHVGRRDIAQLLMAHGARADIFTFAMLGNLDAVKAIIAANPGIQRTKGPHGIPLMAHARAGKEQATAVVEYLQSLGDADVGNPNAPLDSAARAAMLGEYVYIHPVNGEPLNGVSCSIVEQREILQFKHEPDGSRRNLCHLGNNQFHPAGAPDVRVSFKDGVLNIIDGDIAITARHRG